MIALEQTVAILLCAGASRRFGPDDKLLATLRGKPLVLHAAGLLAALPLRDRIAVTPARRGALPEMLGELGFTLVVNEQAEAGHDRSARLGLAGALEREAGAALICLGDMPNVTAGHVAALARSADAETAAMSSTGRWSSPPTLMPAGMARRILDEPHRPVKDVLTGGKLAYAIAAAATLADFDTLDDFLSSEIIAS